MGYYSTITRNEVLTHATTWVNPENIMPDTEEQILYDVVKIIETESRSVVAWDREGGMGSDC